MTPVADVAASHTVAAQDDALCAALADWQHPGKAYALPKTGSYTTPVDATRATSALWDEYLERTRAERPLCMPAEDDGVTRMLEVTLGRSTVIGSLEDPPITTTGVLLGVHVRESTDSRQAEHVPQSDAEA
jgi:hypothetical protein